MIKTIRLLLALLITVIMMATLGCTQQYGVSTTISPKNCGTIVVYYKGEEIAISTETNTAAYEEGSLVTILAKANSGYRFDHWGGDVTGTSNPIIVNLDTNKNINAYFVHQYTLNLAVSYDNGKTISTTKNIAYDEGTMVPLTAESKIGYRFDHWSGDAIEISNKVTVTMDGDKSITAVYVKQYTLNLSTSKGGSVSPDNSFYDVGTDVTLTATPNPGYRFAGWSGDISVDSQDLNPVVINMDNNKNIVANFVVLQYKLTTAVFPPKGGSISWILLSSGDTDTPNSDIFDAGTKLLLAVEASSGYIFDCWSGDVTGTNTTGMIIMDSNKSVNAHFKMFFSPLLSPVCQGTGVPQAAAYQGVKHPIVFMNPQGNEIDCSNVLSMEWLPESVEETQLVAILSGEYSYVLGTQRYIGGWIWIVSRVQYRFDVTLREAKTGRLVARTTLCGSVPPPFPFITNTAIIAGTHVDPIAVKNWIQQYIE